MGALDTVWRVPPDHPAFAGHFPGHPILPGVVLLDHAVLLAQQRLGVEGAVWQVSQAKFLSPCGPGDVLAFQLQEGARGGLSFVVRCGERDVASGQLQASPP